MKECFNQKLHRETFAPTGVSWPQKKGTEIKPIEFENPIFFASCIYRPLFLDRAVSYPTLTIFGCNNSGQQQNFFPRCKTIWCMNDYEAEDSGGDWGDNSLAQSVFANLDNGVKVVSEIPKNSKKPHSNHFWNTKLIQLKNATTQLNRRYIGDALDGTLHIIRLQIWKTYGQVNSRRT